MQIEKALLPVLALFVTCVIAQEAEQQQARDQQPSRGAEAAAGSPQGESGTAVPPGKVTTESTAPTRFVPSETISPDSVIAFPADI